jgi:hypothetical protein
MTDSASQTSMRSFSRPDVILFGVQVLMILVVVCVSLYNLTSRHENVNLWTMILVSCLGYMMPNPKFKTSSLKESKNTQTVLDDQTIYLGQ